MNTQLDAMTQHERAEYWATAKRATAGTIGQLEHKNFRTYWVGKLRGMIVTRPDGTWKFDTKPEAIDAARQFRDMARNKIMPPNAGVKRRRSRPP